MAIKDISDLDVRAPLVATDRLAFYPTGSDTPESGTLTQLAAILATQGFWQMLARSAVAVSHTGNTTETTLATIAVPGGALGPSGVLRITALWRFVNTTAGNKTPRVKFGGTTLYAQNHTAVLSLQQQVIIRNRDLENSQVAGPSNFTGFGSSTGAITTTSLDTATSKDVLLTVQLADGTDTIALDAYEVEVNYGA